MSSHPDADAFMRGYLRHPTDVTTRLVFADWLEETGRPWNRAWAYYIRLKADADRHEFGSLERSVLERKATEYGHGVAARLTIPARLFVGYPKSLLQLLPAANITVKLAEFVVQMTTLELMPESVARDNLAIPLDEQGSILLLALPDPRDDDAIQKFHFILNRDIVAVRAEPDDLLDAINRYYGQTETESVIGCILYTDPAEYMFAPPPLPPLVPAVEMPVRRLVDQMLERAVRDGANRLRLVPGSEGITVRTWHHGEWFDRGVLPAYLGGEIADALAELAEVEDQLADANRAEGEFTLALEGIARSVRARIRVAMFGPTIDLDW